MSDFYTRMTATANSLILKYGQDVTLNRAIITTDPVTGNDDTGEDPVDPVVKGILTNYDAKLIDGTLIKANDKLLVLDNTVEPLITDRPEIGGSEIGEIVSIKTSNPAGTPICYFVQVRT